MRTVAEGWLTAALVMATSAGCGRENPPEASSNDEADFAVELFGSGTVSTESPEFATSFTPSGDSVFFNRTSPDRSRIDLLYSVRVGGQWEPARRFEPLLGIRAIDPFVSLDGDQLYYSAEVQQADGREGAFGLWQLPLAPGADRVPRPLPAPVNSDSSDVFNSLAGDGTMVFSSRRDGERLVYETRLDAEGWSEPRVLVLGSGESASNPAIHPDGRLLVFARSVGDERPDLYLACREGVNWGVPRRLPAPINSDFTEFAPGFGGAYLYFSSERPGVVQGVEDGVRPPGDIYRTRLAAIESLCAGEQDHALELRRLHEELLAAHRTGDVDRWMSVESPTLVSANGGRITFPESAQRRDQRADYLGRASFDIYRDLREPIVQVSEDGSLGWLIAEVEVRGTLTSASQEPEPFHDVWAWVELYENQNGAWRLVGNVSNRRPGEG